eukprot:1482127-Rhodomonas_salina.1
MAPPHTRPTPSNPPQFPLARFPIAGVQTARLGLAFFLGVCLCSVWAVRWIGRRPSGHRGSRTHKTP